MAEVAGLALGVIALAGIFKDCLEIFSYISAVRSLGQDYEILETKLDVEKTLLLQWAQRVRLLFPEYDERLDDPATQLIIARVLAGVKLLLSESDKLQHRYGLEKQAGEGSADVVSSVENENSRMLGDTPRVEDDD